MQIRIKAPKLADYQREILYNDSRFTITEASTKIGKTFSHIWWIFKRANEPWNKEGYNHWWVAPVYGVAKIAFNRMKRKVSRYAGLYKINESNLSIVCPTGAVIMFKSAKDVDNLYGEDVYSIVFDEAPRAKVDAWYALRTTITATNGIMKMIGNFGGVSNWMHLLKEKAKTNPDFYYKKITAYDGVREGILTIQQVEDAKRDLPPKIFKQLYLAEEQEADDQLISFSSMTQLYENNFITTGRMSMICDIAMLGSDKFVIGIFNGFRLVKIISIDKIEANEIVDKIKMLAAKYEVPTNRIVYDADGLGQYLKGYLRRARPFHNGGKVMKENGSVPNYKNLKNQCAYNLAKRINDDGYYFETTDFKTDIFAELEMLKSYELDKDGKIQIMPKIKIKELLGHSPDILDMLIMREYLELVRSGVATIRSN